MGAAFLQAPTCASSCRMTTPDLPPARPARRPNADYRWTVKKVTAFLRALAACGMVAQAAQGNTFGRKVTF